MKVIKPNFDSLESLKQGDVFTFGDCVLMAIEPTTKNGAIVNCVNLEDGSLENFDGYALTKHPDAFLTLSKPALTNDKDEAICSSWFSSYVETQTAEDLVEETRAKTRFAAFTDLIEQLFEGVIEEKQVPKHCILYVKANIPTEVYGTTLERALQVWR